MRRAEEAFKKLNLEETENVLQIPWCEFIIFSRLPNSESIFLLMLYSNISGFEKILGINLHFFQKIVYDRMKIPHEFRGITIISNVNICNHY